MDSSLLNVVYDDPFDENFVKYGNDDDFWSSGGGTMGMQLAETLNGILPIAPTEDFSKDDHPNSLNIIQNTKNMFNYEEFGGQHLATGGSIEIVTIDPSGDGYDTDSEDEEDSEDNDSDNNIDLLDFERASQCSHATFRTRTDSSSIGDYESHTSDYDEDDEFDNNDIIFNTSLMNNALPNEAKPFNNSILDLDSSLIAHDDLFLDTSCRKSRTFSTNTVNSDVDGLGIQIDSNNFDLAEFITKDDLQLNNISKTSPQLYVLPKTKNETNYKCCTNIAPTASVLPVTMGKNIDSDTDSDVIVDVETVEIDDDEVSLLRKASENLKPSSVQKAEVQKNDASPFTNNVKSNSSWSSTRTANKFENYIDEEKSSTQKPNFSRNFTLVPNKKQCDLLKGKFGKGKGKLKKSTPAKNVMEKAIKQLNSADQDENSNRKLLIGTGGKNLSLLKHERVNISEPSSEDNNSPKKPKLNQSNSQHNIENQIEESPAQKAVKRKLNLEEYKKRRGNEQDFVSPAPQPSSKCFSYKIPKIENGSNIVQTNKDKKLNANSIPKKHSEAVTSIVKSLKEQQSLSAKSVVDPITEAKNKVLRMQELKKAQQMRIIDSTISAKVPRVTKLLPLKEIVKDRALVNESCNKSLNSQATKSEYEEIIIVSASCNTEISIPPVLNPAVQSINNATRSLLKSSALLSTITNTFQKVKSTDYKKLSPSSLIASIQDVVVKKTLPLKDNVTSKEVKDTKKAEHHGEDKIIMHLRKDRLRKRMISIGTQTDLQPEFPSLPLAKTNTLHKSRERIRKHSKRQYRKHVSSSSSDLSSNNQSDSSDTSTISRSRDNSSSSSLDRLRTYDSAIGTGGYSSRSSFKHRSSISSSYSESADRITRGRRQRRTSYTKRSAARKRSCSSYSSSSYTSDSDRSRSPHYRRSRSRSKSGTRSRSRRASYRKTQSKSNNFIDRNVSQAAVEERRIVYVGRIEQETTKDMLRRKFLQYGTIKQISIHFKDTGMKYGFVTFERSEDAFAAIDNSTRDPQINVYDVSFGGRRAFCRASYADLDNAGINTYQSYVFPQPLQQPKEKDSFEALLLKMKANLNANKANAFSNDSQKNASNNLNDSKNKI